ncbi:PAS domain-containing sensor histidine kinase [Maridesulfovibrio sp. FT414]|uniref:PAS domain-containing sensor histidine kinase n=1 Tax=Maridesulfovibrio sp. FT414 TaxID=2979469 RepID=UPI003D800FA4
MKTRSIYKLNSRIRHYICLFLCVFIASSLLSTILFFWSVFNEVDDKVDTWANYFLGRISFLETVVSSRNNFDHELSSILKVTSEGEIIGSRPFPTEETTIRDSKVFPLLADLAPGESRIVKTPGTDRFALDSIFLIKRNDHSFSIAQVPYEELLPVTPRDPELFITDMNGGYIYHTDDTHSLRKGHISELSFSNLHVFATAKTSTSRFGGFTIVLAKDISTEFYAGILLMVLTLSCSAVLIKRSAFLTWDLTSNEKDFIRIGKLMGSVSAKPDNTMNSLTAIQYTAEKIREVNWEEEVTAMSFSENRDYVVATSFFAQNILTLLDNIADYSRELASSRQQYRDLVQVARSIILRMDTNGRCTFFNEYAQNFFGFSKEEMLGNSIVGTVIPKTETKDSFLEGLMDALLKSPESFPVSTNLNVRKDGSEAWIFWTNTPIFDKDGKLSEILSVGIDVTEQKLAEEELQRTRNYIRNIIDSMPSAIIGLNDSGQVTHFNEAALVLTTMDSDEIAGTDVSTAFPAIARYAEKISGAIETGIPVTGIRTQDIIHNGTFQDIIIYPLNSGMKGAVIRIDDATERVRMDEMMIQTEKMMSIGGLAAGMAHEINNPLGGILQGIQNIVRRMSPDLPANVKAAEKAGCTLEAMLKYMEDRKIIKTLNGITDSGVRAAEIVSGMLEFSRKSDSRKAPGDLRKMMDKAAVLAAQDYNLKKKYDFKKINIIKEYDEDLHQVKCTETEIEQVFLNLLRNSAQAMSEWTEMERAPELTIKIHNLGKMVRCTVSDNGPGMNENTRKRVFEPFYTTKAPGSGTGLGLSVSYFIITQNHMGKFDVQSKAGKGTTFTILLPALTN